MNRKRLLERFLQYVQMETTANENTSDYPSTPGQLEMGKVLVQQLQAMGLNDARQDQHGIVSAMIASNVDYDCPTIVFNAHIDTSPETSGANVKPNIIEQYDGNDIQLSGDTSKVILVSENPELKDLVGKTIVTTDGTTLLGGDDKAGIAIIMELTNHLLENPDIEHGPVQVLFTCDEEIGRGVSHVDVPKLNATACYTFDGGGAGELDVETFSADQAVVTISGVNIHPSIGKGRLVNAIRGAGYFLAKLPPELSPECTEGREGFIHPYSIEGGVAKVVIKIILRDFDTAKLKDQADMLRNVASTMCQEMDEFKIDIQIHKQYRNMMEGLAKEPRAVKFATEAYRAIGVEPKLTIIRGGTDGSAFTEKGLPTPNLSSGQHNPHSPLEWACLDEMQQACHVGLEIVKRWAKEKN
jgi:tripeptide aminopeptidase